MYYVRNRRTRELLRDGAGSIRCWAIEKHAQVGAAAASLLYDEGFYVVRESQLTRDELREVRGERSNAKS